MWFFTKNDCPQGVHEAPLVAVVTAFPLELKALLEKVSVQHTCIHKGVEYHFGEYVGVPCVFLCTGVGPRKAQKSVHELLSFLNVTKLVFSGIAGGVSPTLTVGDVVVPREWTQLGSEIVVSVDSTEYERCGLLPNIEQVERGVTSATFVDTKEQLQDVDVVDMESFFVLRTAHEHGVPCVVIKGVSDPHRHAGDDESFAIAASRSAVATLAYLSLVAEEKQ